MILFYGVLFVLFLVLLFIVENEKYWGAFVYTAIVLTVGYFLFKEDVSAHLSSNPITMKDVILWVVVYFVVGFFVSIAKWAFSVRKAQKCVLNHKKQMTPDRDFDWYLRQYNLSKSIDIKLKDGVVHFSRSSDFGAYVGAWITWWPVILTQMLVSDILLKIGTYMGEVSGKMFDGVASLFDVKTTRVNVTDTAEVAEKE